jgi:hypothetical protein
MGNISNPDYSRNVKQEARREYRSGFFCPTGRRPIFKYTPLHPPLARGDMRGVRQKPRRSERPRMSDDILSSVHPLKIYE